MQQQKRRAEDGRNWKGDLYDEEKGGYYGDNHKSRISSNGEGRVARGKKVKPKRVEKNNERFKKEGSRTMKKSQTPISVARKTTKKNAR